MSESNNTHEPSPPDAPAINESTNTLVQGDINAPLDASTEEEIIDSVEEYYKDQSKLNPKNKIACILMLVSDVDSDFEVNSAYLYSLFIN